jgi:hypothetical protein
MRFAVEEEGYPAWVGRAVYFGGNGAGDYFVWDAGKRIESRPKELPIFEVRYWECEPHREALSFLEFIRNTQGDVREDRRTKPREGRAPDGKLAFDPLFLRMKERPKRKDVTRWLAFNHSTVHDIARSIRRSVRVGAFPVLADALEEAGCNNPDMLYSCRCGDPEIDGVWVLNVLLGEKK